MYGLVSSTVCVSTCSYICAHMLVVVGCVELYWVVEQHQIEYIMIRAVASKVIHFTAWAYIKSFITSVLLISHTFEQQ